MSEINYKAKYEALKLKFMNAVDMAYRLGFEDGAKQSQMDQMMQAQQQQAELEQQAAAGGMGEGAPGEEQPQEAAPDSAHPDGSELDQHIAELEGLLGKTEAGSEQYQALKKSLDTFKSYKLKIDLKKSELAIKGIAKALQKPKFAIGKQANHNLSNSAKQAVSKQEEIVRSVMKSWEQEESRAAKNIKNVLTVEGLTKKE